jgi:putative ABC transport system permease protein
VSVVLEERPAELETTGSGNGPARRAIFRWSWRLFRREWRQQLLVLALVLFSVAATTVGVGLAYNAGQPQDSTFGSANSMMTFSGNDRADVTAAQRAFGTVDEIDDQNIAIPGSLATFDLRAEDPNGKYGRPTLRLVEGRYPSGPDEIAPTKSTAATLGW